MSLSVDARATSIEGALGETRIYYQVADGSIYERSGRGPAASGSNYSKTRKILRAGAARKDTPLAVVTWGDTQGGKFYEIRLYYITPDDHICELECNDYSEVWAPGVFDVQRYRIAKGTNLLYATTLPVSTNPGSPRVGFRDPERPDVITEASWVNGWSLAVLE